MSPHFGTCPDPDNLIQIESGPSIENLVKEISWSGFHIANPGPILKQSMYNNTFERSPLGGDLSIMSHGVDNQNVIGMLPDIHPRGNSTEEKHCDSAPNEEVVENLKEDSSNEASFNVCYIIMVLLLISVIIAIICKIQ